MQQYKAENLPLEQREIIWGKFGPNNFYLGKKPNQIKQQQQIKKQTNKTRYTLQSICVVKIMVIHKKQ